MLEAYKNYAKNSTLTFTGNTIFRNNSAEYVGGIRAWHMSTLNFSGDTTFRNNIAVYGGRIRTLSSTLHFTGNTIFRSNSAEDGGGIYAWYCTLNFSGALFSEITQLKMVEELIHGTAL